MSPTTPSFSRTLLLVAAAVAVVAAPAALATVLGWPGTLGVGVFAAVVTFPSALMVGVRLAAPLCAAITVTGTIAVQLTDRPALGALLMAAVGAATGWTATKGLQGAVLFWPIALSFLLVDPPPLFDSGSAVPDGGSTAWLAVAVVLAVAGLWGMALGALAWPRVPHHDPVPVRSQQAVPYTVALSLCLAVTAAVALAIGVGHAGAWLMLTTIVLLRPERSEMAGRVSQRVVGTFVGFVGAGALVAVLPAGPALTIGGLLALAVALTYALRGPYPYFAAWMTMAVVLLGARDHDGFTLDLERFGFTLAGAAIVVALTYLVGGVRPLATTDG